MDKTLVFTWGNRFCVKVKAENADDFERILGDQGITAGDIEIRETVQKSPSQQTIRLIAKMSVDTWSKHFAPSARQEQAQHA